MFYVTDHLESQVDWKEVVKTKISAPCILSYVFQTTISADLAD